MIQFQPYGKTPRLFKQVTVTEKIDGTNAGIQIVPMAPGEKISDFPDAVAFTTSGPGEGEHSTDYAIHAQSRNRFLEVGSRDNMGFAAFVQMNAKALATLLGPGLHYGEWWGPGIQKNPHDAEKKHFSLFDTHRFGHLYEDPSTLPTLGGQEAVVTSVPVLFQGNFRDVEIPQILADLDIEGSFAKPRSLITYRAHGRAEGVIVYFHETRQKFKAFVGDNSTPKSLQ